MNLSLRELNELVYCIGRVIEKDGQGSYGHEERQELFNKIYAELEERVKHIEDNIVPINDLDLSWPECGSTC